jgi:hypothetical protein
MSAERSIAVYGAYLLANGIALLLAPRMVLGLLGLPPSDEPWVRVLGVLASEVGFYFLIASRKRIAEFFAATIHGRLAAAAVFVAIVVAGVGPLQLLLFAAIDLLTAAWTYLCIKRCDEAS